MPTLELDHLIQQNRRLKLGLIGLCGLIVLTFASGQVSVPQDRSNRSYHAAVAVDNADGYVVLVRNDGKVVRIERTGRPTVINP
ncbi:MAG: hypothetical protein AAGA25_08125 [Planctomycetota bacterium]